MSDHSILIANCRFWLRAALIAFTLWLTCLVVTGSLAPRVTYAAPPLQNLADLCSLLPGSPTPHYIEKGTDPSASCAAYYFPDGACDRGGIGIRKYSSPDEAREIAKGGAQQYAPSSRYGTGGVELLPGNNVQDACVRQFDFSSSISPWSWSQPINSFYCGNYAVSVSADPNNASAVGDIALAVDRNLKSLGACTGQPAQPPASGRLNVGIGGNYDENEDLVDVTAGVESRPGVGIGDDFYEWSLDGIVVKQGKELKAIQLSTANLAAGKHEIVVKVTDNVNKVSGGATFTFEIKKGGPPAANPPASASGTLTVETSGGSKTVNPGGSTQLEARPGDKVSMKMVCENLVSLGLLFVLAGGGGEEGVPEVWRDYYNVGLRILLAVEKLNCIEHLSRAGQVAMADSPSVPGFRIMAMPNAPVQLKIEMVQGPLRVDMTDDKVVMEIDTSTSIVTSVGKNRFDVLFAPKTGNTIVAAHQGTVSVQSQDSQLPPVTLRAGQYVTVTESGISPIAAIPTGSDPLAGMAIITVCGGASLLGLLALFAGVIVLTRSRRQPAKPSAAPPAVPERATASGWTCTRCGTANRAAARFCNRCGAPR